MKILRLVLFAGALASGFGASAASAQPAPEARIHPRVTLRDSQGANVLRSGGPVSPSATCGECHDTEYIETHSIHSDPGLLAFASPPWAVSSRPWDPEGPADAEMNCFLCHLPNPANEDRLEVLEEGRGMWAATATLVESGLVSGAGMNWGWRPGSFDAQGRALPDHLPLQTPSSANCALCHGLASDDTESPVALGGIRSGSLQTLSRGEIFSAQRISESGINLAGKAELNRSWDVHAERLLECANCHYSVNNPVFRMESKETQPEGLKFDSRRMPLGAYLQRPNHNFAGQAVQGGQTRPVEALTCTTCHDPEPTHTWLPYAQRHMDALSCELCHTPKLYSVVVESVDWTTLDGDGNPGVSWRGCAEGCETAATDLVRGVEPAVLARQDADGRTRLAPYNLVTSWYWVGGSEGEPVDLELVGRTSGAGSAEAVAVLLGEMGIEDPRIIGEIKPYAIHHGVAEGEWATRDCQSCHDGDSRLAQEVLLADGAPGGVMPTPLASSDAQFPGQVEIGEGGAVLYRSRTADAGLYVLGHDAVWWANLLGVFSILGTLMGVAVHGALRWRASRSRIGGAVEEGRPVYMYRTYERVWHWLQALAIMLLILTGVEIHVASLGLMDFGLAVRVHNILGFVVLANALFAAFFHLASGEIQQYLPRPRGFFGQAIAQTRFYLSGIFKGEPHPFEKSPERKLNPLQQVTYMGILNVLLPLQILTGVLMWGVQRWPMADGLFGGLTFLAPLHALVAWLFAAFLVMHIYLTTTGPTPMANIRAMVVGWEATELHPGSSEAK